MPFGGEGADGPQHGDTAHQQRPPPVPPAAAVVQPGLHPPSVYTPYQFASPADSPALASYGQHYHGLPYTPHQPPQAMHAAHAADDPAFRSPTLTSRAPTAEGRANAPEKPYSRQDGRAAASEARNGLDEAVGAAASTSGTAPPKIVKKADRSCKKCRERRVRCGREYPTCSRCKKRRDACSYGEGVFVEEVVEGSDQQRIAELESKISTLQSQLKTTSSSIPSRSSSNSSPPLATVLSSDNLPDAISRPIIDSLNPIEQSSLVYFLDTEARNEAGRMDASVGGGSDGNGLAEAITRHLLDAACRACDSKLPGLANLVARVDFYKAHLRELDAPGRVSVAVLCALGARTSPHHTLFGISSVQGADGSPSPSLFAAVGSRRENLCRSLESQARETAWATGLFRDQSYEGLEALVGLMVLSMHEENDLEDTRFLVRQAVGTFLDIRHAELRNGKNSTLGPTMGTAIFMVDAYVAVRTGRVSLITPGELQEFWSTAGFDVPDLINPCITHAVQQVADQPVITWEAVQDVTTIIFNYTLACYRVFAQVVGPVQKPDSSSLLGFIRNLWHLIDQIHNAIQRFQQRLVSLATPISGANDDPHGTDHAILLAVWADDMLVNLVGLVHLYLMRDRNSGQYGPEREGDEELERTRAESSMRVFKCLKLLACLYCNSQDRHNVIHLLMHLVPLSNWTSLVAMRIGQPGGPLNEEFEITEEELDWFRMALELSLFYSPQLSSTLRALNNARQLYIQRGGPPPAAPPPPSVPNGPASYPSTAHSNTYMPVQAQQADPGSSPKTMPASLQFSYPQLDQPHQHSHQHQHQHPQHQRQQQQQQQEHDQQYRSQSFHMFDFPQPIQLDQRQPVPALPPPHRDHPLPFALDLDAQLGHPGFADGAGEDPSAGGSDVRSAFRSIDWADLSLTPAPAVGSEGSSSSIEEWLKRPRRNS
uniref:BY PROTMAP: gi/472585859/gb/EMS23401.1/ C6 transcription factor [Rhodosporidium toruloides NP11] gi/647395744/emb/CDR37411.1/ RHTO0S02e14554g1_1 [Rhodosporidium toruloides] n=1 Tax=Rhodotorula toruloides TaxID=5286 RepID=A0A0K3CDM4_RHOTO